MYEKQRYDGWYNNRAHPEWGSSGKWTKEEFTKGTFLDFYKYFS